MPPTRLNLAASKSGNSFPAIVKFKRTLSKLHEFYSRSALRTKGLDSVQKLLSDSLDTGSDGEKLDITGKVQDPSPTRWLALGKCAVGLKKILPSVLISLSRESEERGEIVAAGLYHMMTKIEFIAILLLLCDILPNVNILSCLLQAESVDFSQVEKFKKSTLEALKTKKQKPSNNDTFRNILQNLSSNDIKVDVTDEEKQKVALQGFDTKIKQPFVQKLIENISERFENSHVMEAFGKFADKSYHVHDEPKKKAELNKSVTVLSEQFGFEVEAVLTEVSDIQHYLHPLLLEEKDKQSKNDNLKKKKKKLKEKQDKPSKDSTPNKQSTSTQATNEETDSSSLFVDMLLSKKTASVMFPNLSKLAQIYKTLPPHTADCERAFSKMKLVKSDTRNRMREDTLEKLMRISINGPPPENFPHVEAVKLWAQKRERRYKVRLVL